jgi:dolichyl-phosphate beta-glucosyltransferase
VIDERANLSISIVIPVHNSAETLDDSINTILEFVMEKKINYEILLVENGSVDNSPAIIERLSSKNKNIRKLTTPQGLGNALSCGIAASCKDFVLLTADDLPFGISDFDQFIANIFESDVLIGSKHLSPSKRTRSPIRRMLTYGFRILRKLILSTKIQDSQGTFFISSTLAKRISSNVQEKGFLFTTEFAFLAEKEGLAIKEVPIIFSLSSKRRRSTVKTSSVASMFIGIFRIRIRYLRHKHG